jgi:hypothetical protein
MRTFKNKNPFAWTLRTGQEIEAAPATIELSDEDAAIVEASAYLEEIGGGALIPPDSRTEDEKAPPVSEPDPESTTDETSVQAVSEAPSDSSEPEKSPDELRAEAARLLAEAAEESK